MALVWVFLLFCGWLAATVSGAAGFGGALLLLPVLTFTVGVKAAVPILTVAQFLGNLSRAGFGWREIQWRPALVFSAGAVPASVIGSQLFVALPSALILRLIGSFLLVVVLLRHTALGQRKIPEALFAPAGSGVGFLSAVAGSRRAAGCVGLPESAPSGTGLCRKRGRDGSPDSSGEEHHLWRVCGVDGGRFPAWPRLGRVFRAWFMDGTKADRPATGEGILSHGRSPVGRLRRVTLHRNWMIDQSTSGTLPTAITFTS